jgi:hypothetical protein
VIGFLVLVGGAIVATALWAGRRAAAARPPPALVAVAAKHGVTGRSFGAPIVDLERGLALVRLDVAPLAEPAGGVRVRARYVLGAGPRFTVRATGLGSLLESSGGTPPIELGDDELDARTVVTAVDPSATRRVWSAAARRRHLALPPCDIVADDVEISLMLSHSASPPELDLAIGLVAELAHGDVAALRALADALPDARWEGPLGDFFRRSVPMIVLPGDVRVGAAASDGRGAGLRLWAPAARELEPFAVELDADGRPSTTIPERLAALPGIDLAALGHVTITAETGRVTIGFDSVDVAPRRVQAAAAVALRLSQEHGIFR